MNTRRKSAHLDLESLEWIVEPEDGRGIRKQGAHGALHKASLNAELKA